MRISELLQERMVLSLEVFPPKTDAGMDKLCGKDGSLERFYELRPDYISCTYGAGGSNIGRNLEVLKRIKADGKCIPMTHFNCIRNTKDGIRDQLQTYLDSGVGHVLALRGDLPGFSPRDGACQIHTPGVRRQVRYRRGGIPGRPSALQEPECGYYFLKAEAGQRREFHSDAAVLGHGAV